MMRLYMEKYKPNIHCAGRGTLYKVPDVMDLGQHLVFNLGGAVGDLEEKGADQAIDEEDLATELYDW